MEKVEKEEGENEEAKDRGRLMEKNNEGEKVENIGISFELI